MMILDPSKYPRGLTNTQRTIGKQEMLRAELVFSRDEYTN